MSVNSNYTTFAALSGAFLTDMARDLELDPKQVRLNFFVIVCSKKTPCAAKERKLEPIAHQSSRELFNAILVWNRFQI